MVSIRSRRWRSPLAWAGCRAKPSARRAILVGETTGRAWPPAGPVSDGVANDPIRKNASIALPPGAVVGERPWVAVVADRRRQHTAARYRGGHPAGDRAAAVLRRRFGAVGAGAENSGRHGATGNAAGAAGGNRRRCRCG